MKYASRGNKGISTMLMASSLFTFVCCMLLRSLLCTHSFKKKKRKGKRAGKKKGNRNHKIQPVGIKSGDVGDHIWTLRYEVHLLLGDSFKEYPV
jgi:hypothetical protein